MESSASLAAELPSAGCISQIPTYVQKKGGWGGWTRFFVVKFEWANVIVPLLALSSSLVHLAKLYQINGLVTYNERLRASPLCL